MNEAERKAGAAPRRAPANDIDGYLAAVPKKARAALERLRRTVRAAAPDAQEKICYGIPAFYDTRPLVGFAAFKHHLSFFPMSVATMERFEKELESYDKTRGAIHFTADRPLPAALVKRIVSARVLENGQRARNRRPKKPSGQVSTRLPS